MATENREGGPPGCRRAAGQGCSPPVTRERLPAPWCRPAAARSTPLYAAQCRRRNAPHYRHVPRHPTFLTRMVADVPRRNPTIPPSRFSLLEFRAPTFDFGQKKCNVDYRGTYTSSDHATGSKQHENPNSSPGRYGRPLVGAQVARLRPQPRTQFLLPRGHHL